MESHWWCEFSIFSVLSQICWIEPTGRKNLAKVINRERTQINRRRIASKITEEIRKERYKEEGRRGAADTGRTRVTTNFIGITGGGRATDLNGMGCIRWRYQVLSHLRGLIQVL